MNHFNLTEVCNLLCPIGSMSLDEETLMYSWVAPLALFVASEGLSYLDIESNSVLQLLTRVLGMATRFSPPITPATL